MGATIGSTFHRAGEHRILQVDSPPVALSPVSGDKASKPLIWLSDAQMDKIERYFPLSHGMPRVDDRRVLSGILFVLTHGVRWRDAPKAYGPHKTIYNRFVRWSRLGAINRIFAALAYNDGRPDPAMIGLAQIKAHRTGAVLLKQGLFPDLTDAPNWCEQSAYTMFETSASQQILLPTEVMSEFDNVAR